MSIIDIGEETARNRRRGDLLGEQLQQEHPSGNQGGIGNGSGRIHEYLVPISVFPVCNFRAATRVN